MPLESSGTETVTTIRELMSLKGRCALITGATGHLGSVMADTLAELGADLVLVDRPGSDYQAVTTSLNERWVLDRNVAIVTWNNSPRGSPL